MWFHHEKCDLLGFVAEVITCYNQQTQLGHHLLLEHWTMEPRVRPMGKHVVSLETGRWELNIHIFREVVGENNGKTVAQPVFLKKINQ